VVAGLDLSSRSGLPAMSIDPLSQYPNSDVAVADFTSKKIPAGLCGIFLGPLGVHKFVLGLTTPGIIMLLFTILTLGFGSLIMGPIGLIEGILYLTKSDREFYQRYAVEKKGWF
jgi:TM2 domain-containing membrane protein YozV